MERKRVVITGMGAMTPIGAGAEKFWRALLDGVNGVGPLTFFDTTDYTTRIAGQTQ